MSPRRIGRRQRDRIATRAGHRCSYCRSGQQITGNEGQIDHVQPESRGGSDEDDNLPVHQSWTAHFAWAEGGAFIVGQTPTGRATVRQLKLNRPWLVHARRRWIEVGWHPPADDT